ncbi:hypothetical protein CV102_19075 [Natronococcus pandeyae]|uniref:Uncharacterized protein n=1 Tax=Natronococcus pandeyae TaxID=2055836 RepID=A0A8J8TQW4_9EURY|nr:DUF6517 family protein [Natronococcus pandeyae]TYL37119.1 hypothetical protein CV102_19075 [Natronococcus pandeyae]
MNRRQFVATAAAGCVGVSAGCLNGLIDDVTTFSASPAVVDESAADEAGYTYQGTEETVRSETVAGEDVEATNYITEYTRTIETPLGVLGGDVDAGVFAVITTPQVSVADEDFNPVGDMTSEEIVELIQDQYDELEVGDSIDGRAVEALDGTTVSLDSYEGEAAFQGQQEVDVFLDIATPDHGGDHFVIVGVYPDDGNLPSDSERDRVDVIIRGLEHGDDVDAEIVEDDG